MDEELQKQESVELQTETVQGVEKATPDVLPSLEDFAKSEQEVKVNAEIEGVSQVEQKTQSEDRFFTKKSDEKKVYMKKRFKILTAVYTSIVTLMLSFVIANVATMAILNKEITTNTKTMQSQKDQIVEVVEQGPEGTAGNEFIQINLNQPRDYSEDKKELTFLDKITILFNNIFS